MNKKWEDRIEEMGRLLILNCKHTDIDPAFYTMIQLDDETFFRCCHYCYEHLIGWVIGAVIEPFSDLARKIRGI